MTKWQTVKLSDVAYEVSDRVDNPSTSDYDRFVGLDNFVGGDFKISNWSNTDNLVSAMKLFKAGDTLFARRNAYLKRVSMADFDGICSGDAIVLRNNEKMIDGFLPLILNTDHFWEYAIANAAGTMSKRVRAEDLMKYEFPLPPVDEQRRIADLLWAADDVIQKWETAKQSALQLLESTLFENFSSELMPGSKQNWEIAPLNQVAHLQTGIAKGKSYGNEIETVELPYLSVLNVQDGYIDLTGIKTIVIPKKEVGKYLLQSNDIVIAEGGDSDKVGRGAIWRGEIDICLHQNHIFCIRTNKEKLLSEFLSFQMRSRYGKAYFLKGAKKTSNLASINSTQVKQFPVLLCSLDIQNKIVSQITQLENAVNQIYEHLSVSINLKKSLLAQFLS